MIISASRRTDIPSFYGRWFINRLREGFFYTFNPFNSKTVLSMQVSPETVECIVFWTKDPAAFLSVLDEIDEMGYRYYFQFTITPYDTDIETNIRAKDKIMDTFVTLSERIGKEKVILRYDPILLTDRYNLDFHDRAFADMSRRLADHTKKIVISFIDRYRKNSSDMKSNKIRELTVDEMTSLGKSMASHAKNAGLTLETCAEEIDLSRFGIGHSSCVDGRLIESITGSRLKGRDKSDPGRAHCGCMKSIDIGRYDCCIHNCLYCYANINREKAVANFKAHEPSSPVLYGDYRTMEIKARKDAVKLRLEDSDD